MSGDGVGRAVFVELAYSRSQQDGERQRAPALGGARLKKKAVEANQAPVPPAHLGKMAKHHRAAQVSGRGVDGAATELEGEADRKVPDQAMTKAAKLSIIICPAFFA